jgi:hypothetical protein
MTEHVVFPKSRDGLQSLPHRANLDVPQTRSHRNPTLATKRTKLKPQNYSVEHVVYGVGSLLHVHPLDGGILVAVAEFAGVERTIRLAPEYFVTPIPEIMKIAPRLAPPPKPVVKKAKAIQSGADHADDREEDADDGENDSHAQEVTWL